MSHRAAVPVQRKHAGAYKGFKGLRPIEGAPTEKGEVLLPVTTTSTTTATACT
jgi:hypothetical protein